MSDFEQVLDECLQRLTDGDSTLEDCLDDHSEDASRLRPLLQNAVELMYYNRDVYVSPIFKARGRAKLTLYMQDHPRQRPRTTFALWRLAVSVAVLVIALLSVGTVRAQSALPGDLFYVWKLASENVWRGFSHDRGHVDLVLADRRVNEIVATANDPTHQARALHDYEEILTRLQSQSGVETDSEEKILFTLESNQKSLKDAGLTVPKLDAYLGPHQNDGKTPSDLPQTLPVIEIPPLKP